MLQSHLHDAFVVGPVAGAAEGVAVLQRLVLRGRVSYMRVSYMRVCGCVEQECGGVAGEVCEARPRPRCIKEGTEGEFCSPG